jgi:hypothetical protein
MHAWQQGFLGGAPRATRYSPPHEALAFAAIAPKSDSLTFKETK